MHAIFRMCRRRESSEKTRRIAFLSRGRSETIAETAFETLGGRGWEGLSARVRAGIVTSGRAGARRPECRLGTLTADGLDRSKSRCRRPRLGTRFRLSESPGRRPDGPVSPGRGLSHWGPLVTRLARR